MNKVIEGIKKTALFITIFALALGLVAAVPNIGVSAAEKNVYSFMNDFPKKQGENGWRMYCGATTSFYDSAKNEWTNKDTHQIPSSFKKDVIKTCNNGGVSYIDFIAPKSGSVSIVFKAKITAPANDGGDGTYGGGLFGIHLSDAKRSNPNEADKQSAEPIFPAGLEAWFISGRYELQDGETLAVEEFVDITKGQIIQFCFCSKGDPWKLDLQAFEVRYDDDADTSGSSVAQSAGSAVTNKEEPTKEEPTASGASETSSGQAASSENTDSEMKENASETTGNESGMNDDSQDESTNTEKKEKSYTGLIIGIAVGAAALIGIIAAVFVICHKKGII